MILQAETIGFFIVGFVGLCTVLGFLFWLWMLVDCATNEPDEGNTRLIWLVIILVGNFLGALLYFFVRRFQRIREVGV